MTAADAAKATDQARSALIRGAVGDGAGVEFLAWLVEMDLPDPEEVLANPAAFRLPERGDRAYAALAAVAAAVAAEPTPERWTAAWQVLGGCAEHGARRGSDRGAGAGQMPPGRHAAARRDQAVRPGAARRRAAGLVGP